MPVVKVERHFKFGKRAWSILGGLALVLVAGGVVWYLSMPTPEQAVKQADELNQKRQYIAAMAVLKKAQWRSYTQVDKALILSRQIATAMNSGDLEGALVYCQEFERVRPGDYSNLLNQAELLQRLDRPKEAATVYRRALEILKKLPPSELDSVEDMQARIEELEK